MINHTLQIISTCTNEQQSGGRSHCPATRSHSQTATPLTLLAPFLPADPLAPLQPPHVPHTLRGSAHEKE